MFHWLLCALFVWEVLDWHSYRYAKSHPKDKTFKLAEEVDIQVGLAKRCVCQCLCCKCMCACVCVLRDVVNDSRGRGMGACASNTRENARPRLSKRPKGTRREERADLGMLVFLHLL